MRTSINSALILLDTSSQGHWFTDALLGRDIHLTLNVFLILTDERFAITVRLVIDPLKNDSYKPTMYGWA
jgi:hypothetical protein